MAYSKLRALFGLGLVLITVLTGCSSPESGLPQVSQKKTGANAELPALTNWCGLPSKFKMPAPFDGLSFHQEGFDATGPMSDALTEVGFELSAQSRAKIVLNKNRTPRYLKVISSCEVEKLISQWGPPQQGLIDGQEIGQAWLEPKARLQTHLNRLSGGFELTFGPLTPTRSISGRPTGMGLSFASYIGKPFEALAPLLTRHTQSADGKSILAWAPPIQFETVSLKMSIQVGENNQRVETIKLFLKDRPDDRLRQLIEGEVASSWTSVDGQVSTFQSGEIVVQFRLTPQLGLRNRTHKNFTILYQSAAKAL